MITETTHLTDGDILQLPSMHLVVTQKLIERKYRAAFEGMGKYLTKKSGLAGYRAYRFKVVPNVIMIYEGPKDSPETAP